MTSGGDQSWRADSNLFANNTAVDINNTDVTNPNLARVLRISSGVEKKKITIKLIDEEGGPEVVFEQINKNLNLNLG